MQRDEVGALYERMLLELWHAADDVLDDLARQIASDDLVIHQNGDERHSPSALADLVREGRRPFDDVAVDLAVGPAVDGDLVAGRWTFSGRYAGGIPGASADEGTPVSFSGLDLVRIDGGKVAEYWVCSDDAALLQQLGVH